MTRVLLTLHHWLDPNAGASGSTLAIGRALEQAGCEVTHYAFDHAFRRVRDSRWTALAFPWRVAGAHARRGRRFDVVDASTGDAWVWLRVPRARRPPIVTRSHGLEHLAVEAERAALRGTGRRHGRKYELYHAGLRLREVRASLLRADHCILLNESEREYVVGRLGVPAERTSVVPHGLADSFHGLPGPRPPGDGPLAIAFIGSWIERKAPDVVTAVADRLSESGVPFRLLLLGTGTIPSFGDRAWASDVEVVPSFAHATLPARLRDQHVLLSTSRFEGFGRGLLEGMAAGLAPVATPVGVAPDVVRDGRNGILVGVDDVEAMVAALRRLDGARDTLQRIRAGAQESAQAFAWATVAERRIRIYERVREGR